MFSKLDETMNESVKQNLRTKIAEYLTRAEKIKDLLNNKQTNKKPVKTGNGATKDEESGDEEDKEKKKMISQLEGKFCLSKLLS